MPKFKITGPDGQNFEVTAPDGTSEAEVLAYAQKNFKLAAQPKPAKPFGKQLNDFIADVPRQVGLTARYGIEAAGGTFDALLGNPLRTLASPVLGNRPTADTGGTLANLAGLPQPQTADERIVGDMTRLGFGAAGGAAIAKGVAGVTSGTTKAVATQMARQPAVQIASGAAAGGAGGYVRETGGNAGAQLAAALAAGIATPFGANAAARGAQAMRPRPAPSPVQIDVTINRALEQSGLDLGQLPAQVAQGIRTDVAKAMQIGGNLSPDAVRRLADYRLVGATPNRAGLTLDPADVSQQRNLAKLGINSKDPAAQALGRMENANNRQLTTGLNGLGASAADDVYAGGQKIIGGVDDYNTRATGIIAKLYDKARASNGRSAALDPSAFTRRADELLTHNLRNAELPTDIRTKLNSFADGSTPLTVETAEQFKTIMAKIQRGSSDGGVRDAISHVRTALEEAPLLPGQNLGASAQMAFNRARSMHRQYMGVVEKTPALQAVRDGIEPDKFVQQFIVGSGGKSNVMDVAQLKNSIKSSPDALEAVRTQITSHLKARALNGATDEVGNFSQSAYNKALNSIGDRKLKLFFTKEQIDQMKAIGRVASYEQVQPTGAAVNNSNTAGAGLATLFDRVGNSPLLSKVPFGRQIIGEPLENIALSMNSGRALDAPRALTDGLRLPLQSNQRGLAMTPAMLMSTEDEEERRKREAGLIP